jgi:hypothetical protein
VQSSIYLGKDIARWNAPDSAGIVSGDARADLDTPCRVNLRGSCRFHATQDPMSESQTLIRRQLHRFFNQCFNRSCHDARILDGRRMSSFDNERRVQPRRAMDIPLKPMRDPGVGWHELLVGSVT